MQPSSRSPLTRSYGLDAGPRVALRLARRRDTAAVGVLIGERRASELLSFDPGRRIVLCATAPLDGGEAVVGVGAIDRGADTEPDTVVVDEVRTEGLDELLGAVLRSRAAA